MSLHLKRNSFLCSRMLTLLLLSITFLSVSKVMGSGFIDNHDRGVLINWEKYGDRDWSEHDGRLYPQDQTNASGFLINNFKCADNGTLTVNIQGDSWNGHNGGVVFRWTSPASYYYLALRSGNEWDNGIYLCTNTTDIWQGTCIAKNCLDSTSSNLQIELDGSNISVTVDGKKVCTVTDAAHANGQVGYGYNAQWNRYTSFDNFTWTNKDGSVSTTVSTDEPAVVNGDLEVFIKDEGINENNIIKIRMYVKNNGLATVNHFSVYYFFKAEAGKEPVLEDYYTPNCDVFLENLGDDDYIVSYEFKGKDLVPGGVLPDLNGNVIGLHYSDWSAIAKDSSFSYVPSTEFANDTDVAVLVGDSVVSGSAPVYAGGTRTVARIATLKCNKTEDWTGADECRLHVYVDGQYYKTLYKNLNDGQTWNINEEVPFNQSVELRLYDKDAGWGDDDDNLGTVVFTKTVGTSTKSFTGDEASYDVVCEVFTEDIPLSLVTVNTSKHIIVKTLYCSQTEDYSGDDESKLKLVLDGVLVGEFSKDLNNGETYDINAEYTFTGGGFFNLYDQDAGSWYDEHDFLGKVGVNTEDGVHTGTFSGDGANYTVTYEISTKTEYKTDLTTFMIEKFKVSTQNGVWDYINKDTLLKQISAALVNPAIVYQGDYGFCGPIAIEHVLAKRYPIRFVSLCRQIFEKAKFNGASKVYKVASDEDVLGTKPNSSITQLDFMFCGFIRDEANGIFDIDEDEWAISHFTTPWEMEDWTYDILGFTDTDIETSFLWGEVDALESGVNAADNGGVAFLLVDGEELQEDNSQFTITDGHWIVYDSDYKYKSDGDSYKISFNCYTWGYIKYVELGESNFEDLMQGAVFGY